MPRRALLLPLLVALAALAVPAAGRAAGSSFQTPSKNVRCASLGSLLRCDMVRLGNAPKPRPASCDFDYGNSFGITRNGSRGRYLCVSDAVSSPSAPVLRYGRTWRRDGFTCTSRQTDLRCTNARGHGFELRLGRQRVF